MNLENKIVRTNKNLEMKIKKTEKNTFSDITMSLDSSTANSLKIELEKRKRHQTYLALDYLLSSLTYFDFFSGETFNIVKNAKYLAQICNRNVTSEFLLLPFFSHPSEVSIVLEEFGLSQIDVENLIIRKFLSNKKENFFEKQKEKISHLIHDVKGLFILETVSLDQNVNYSHEVNQIFERSAENALQRFKTPVITPEILFITMMEEKNSAVSKLLRKALKTDTQWYLFRYKLIKRIHKQESNIRGEIIKNQHFFAYLMKTQLSELEFNKLIETENLAKGVSFFRNTLVSKILETNIFEKLLEEILTSIKVNNKRSYSS